jgi:septal ring factor EnvC (AmiA/AmiB activator)
MRRFAALLMLLLAGPAATASITPGDLAADPLQVQLREAQAQAAQADARQRRIEQAAASARDQAAKLRLEQLAAAERIAAQEARISSADAEATLLARALFVQRQRLAKERAPVSSLLAGLALSGRRPPLALIAGDASVHELIKLKLLVRAIAPAIEARTAALSRELGRAEAMQAAASKARADAASGRRLLQQRMQELAALEARALQAAGQRGGEAVALGDVSLARDEEVADLQRLQADSRSARQAAAELARLGPAPLPRGPGAASLALKGYRLPVTAPVIEGVGNVGETGIRSRGISFATRRGAAVQAPSNGTLLFAGPFRDYDGVLIIDHGGGWRSVLVNVGSTLPKGSRVEAGQRIGLALGPLELQLQKSGKPVSAALIAGSSAMLSKTARSD